VPNSGRRTRSAARTTSSAQGSRTGAPEFTTTTVRGLAAATWRTRSSDVRAAWSDVRSKPSLSTSAVVPTTTRPRRWPPPATPQRRSPRRQCVRYLQAELKEGTQVHLGEECTSCSSSTEDRLARGQLERGQLLRRRRQGLHHVASRAASAWRRRPPCRPRASGNARARRRRADRCGHGGADHAADLQPADRLRRACRGRAAGSRRQKSTFRAAKPEQRYWRHGFAPLATQSGDAQTGPRLPVLLAAHVPTMAFSIPFEDASLSLFKLQSAIGKMHKIHASVSGRRSALAPTAVAPSRKYRMGQLFMAFRTRR